MTPTQSTRRRVLQGMGAAGTVAVLSGNTAAQEDEVDEEEEPEEEEEVEEEEEMDEDQFAAVRFGHLSPDAPDVDVYLGKTPDMNPTVGALSYPAFGPGPNDGYLQLPPGTYNVAIAPEGTTDPAIEVEEVKIEAGVRYSALALGRLTEDGVDDENDVNGENGNDEDGENDVNNEENDELGDNENDVTGTGLQPLVITDASSRDEATPPADEAELSFVHASPDAGAVDITVDGEVIAENASFGDVTDYFAFDAGENDIGIVSDGEEVLVETRELRAGTSITAYVTGIVGAEEAENGNDEELPENGEEAENGAEMENDEGPENGNGEADAETAEAHDENENGLPGLSVVTTLDGTNPLADGVVTR